MPRPVRCFEEGRTYHVYNRVAGGAPVFADAGLATAFVDLLRQVVQRDQVVVLGWCLLGNHFHLILRQGPAPLSRAMKTLQQGSTRARHLRERSFGPLWQGRFKAKEVGDPRYLLQLVAYVHLNPVKAGLADSADGYHWSGHREVLGRTSHPIVAVDEVLLLYGQTRREALRGYRAAMASVDHEGWSADAPGQLPWWKLGRPTEDERLRQGEGSSVDQRGRSTARWRPRYDAADWLQLACSQLGVSLEALGSQSRDARIVTAREVIGMVGIQRYGVKVLDLAAVLGKSRDGVSQWSRRGERRRQTDPDFAAAVDALDLAASENP